MIKTALSIIGIIFLVIFCASCVYGLVYISVNAVGLIIRNLAGMFRKDLAGASEDKRFLIFAGVIAIFLPLWTKNVDKTFYFHLLFYVILTGATWFSLLLILHFVISPTRRLLGKIGPKKS